MRKTFRISIVALVVMMLLTVVACAPKNMEKAQEKMKDKGYLCLAFGSANEEDGVQGMFTATLLKNGDALAAVLFSSSKEAKDNFEKYKKLVEDEISASSKDDFSVERIGKWIVGGTKQAIKDFK